MKLCRKMKGEMRKIKKKRNSIERTKKKGKILQNDKMKKNRFYMEGQKGKREITQKV